MEIIITESRIKTSKRFESKIKGLMSESEYNAAESINVVNVGIKRSIRYGRYKKYIVLNIDGEVVGLVKHSTDSTLYDDIYHSESDHKVSKVLRGLLEELIESYL